MSQTPRWPHACPLGSGQAREAPDLGGPPLVPVLSHPTLDLAVRGVQVRVGSSTSPTSHLPGPRGTHCSPIEPSVCQSVHLSVRPSVSPPGSHPFTALQPGGCPQSLSPIPTRLCSVSCQPGTFLHPWESPSLPLPHWAPRGQFLKVGSWAPGDLPSELSVLKVNSLENPPPFSEAPCPSARPGLCDAVCVGGGPHPARPGALGF